MRSLQLAGRPIRAISLDLDDTLWPIAPTMRRAEIVLHEWFEQYHPLVAQAYPVPKMRALRERIWAEHPHLQHDFTETRLISLRQAMLPLGAVEADVQRAFSLFFEARNQVELFDGVKAALARLSAVVPIVSLSNGNADLHRIGIAQHFVGSVSAREFGRAKPDPAIFNAAASAIAVRSEPPRPRVVTWPSGVWPWKPATITTWPWFSKSWIRFGVMFWIFALV